METKNCVCGKKMIKRFSNFVYCTYPPQHPWKWWCGGCGREEEGGIEVGKTQEDVYREEWEKANEE